MSSRAALLVAVLAVVNSASPAEAGRRTRVAVLDLTIEGDAPPGLRGQLERSLAGGLYAAGYEVILREDVKQKLRKAPELIGCITTTCLEKVGALVGARRFVQGRVETSGAAYSIELQLLGADVAGAVISRVERSCPVCTIGEANEAMSQAATELPQAQAAARQGVPPEREPVSPAAPAGSRFGPWKWVGAGTAAAAIGLGAALIAVDGTGLHCTPGEPCKDLLATMAGGWVAVGIGIGIAGVTTWLFLNDRPPDMAISVAPVAGGAAAGLRVRF